VVASLTPIPDLVAGSDVCGRRLATVKRVLLTGMSGTGKSSVIQALAARGYKAVDTDDGWCEPLPDGRQRWREDAIEQLLAVEDADMLFVSLRPVAIPGHCAAPRQGSAARQCRPAFRRSRAGR
jgi:hypothetical protein